MHLAAVDAHLAHAERLKATGDADPVMVGWAITALFYAALHAVRGYLRACKDVEVTSHDEFKNLIHAYPELKRTNEDYDNLKQQSQSARYYCNPNFTWADYEHLRRKALRIASMWKAPSQRCIAETAPTKH
jgi:hypothetical protein